MLPCLVLLCAGPVVAEEAAPSSFEIEREVAHRGFDGETCWVRARAGIIPAEYAPHDANVRS